MVFVSLQCEDILGFFFLGSTGGKDSPPEIPLGDAPSRPSIGY
jgi:hypothetical protein